MERKEIQSMLNDSSYYEFKAIKKDEGNVIVEITKKYINCALCKKRTRNKFSEAIQDRRVIGLIVKKKYCPPCAESIKEICSDVKTSYKNPIGTSY